MFDAKGFGEISELVFAVEALNRGLTVSKPLITNKYDLLVDNGKKIFRIQVKATTKPARGIGNYSIISSHGTKSKKLYNNKMIDFFAIYLADVEKFFIIPVSKVNQQKIYVSTTNKKNKYYNYLNNWKVLM